MEFRQKEHNIYTEKNINDFSITLTADIHYDELMKKEKLKILKDRLKANESDYICLVGDLINRNNIKDIDSFLMFLDDISRESKTFISFGNHEVMDIINNEICSSSQINLIKSLEQFKNVIVLNNNYYRNGNIELAGITNSFDYYLYENSETFLEEINEELNIPFDKDNFNILLCHSPINIRENKDEIIVLEDCDIVLSGHNHNGLVFPFLDKSFKDRGFINHRKDLFPKYTKGDFYADYTKVIINGGITKFSNYSKFNFVNNFYYSEIDKINVRKR